MTGPASQRLSTQFGRLHPAVQRWVYDQGWRGLRDVQERAVTPILAGDRDVILAAATASGKTEAAWLPIASALLADPDRAGIAAVYIGPLKALINDQHDRLTALFGDHHIAVHRWHGDVPQSQKQRVLRAPSGVLLITPESLEALFVLHGGRIATLFAGLQHVVVDELHSFVGTERGAQLQSLLHRLELVVRRAVPRIGLSATLGDFNAAADFLRPGRGADVAIVEGADDGGEIRLQLRGYVARRPDEGEDPPHETAIAQHLFETLRGSDNLVFANSRAAVEHYTDRLTRMSELLRVPNEFRPHHGNLAKDIREHVEAQLKDRSTPVTAVCTSTLEMGIDIGSVDSIAQIGPPHHVAALRQRLGRSGRRGDQPAVLRMYVAEHALDGQSSPIDALRVALFQTAAVVDLLLARWYEPPDRDNPHLSTLSSRFCPSSRSAAARVQRSCSRRCADTGRSHGSTGRRSPRYCAQWARPTCSFRTAVGCCSRRRGRPADQPLHVLRRVPHRRGVPPDRRRPDPRHASGRPPDRTRDAADLRRAALGGHRC
ncbi:DEAD/DEAH box helicase [Dactylosporangium darangshiense]|uniref:DEAD/DEAH box helicase n=1 Tax=Dactylosporangium darangshiense TaxID=579108 RepID=UPI003636254F